MTKEMSTDNIQCAQYGKIDDLHLHSSSLPELWRPQ